jgi:predicted ArsR family transcriptional regulator
MTPLSSSSHLPTRLRILDHLRKHHSASAAELSRALQMTVANIRHHLAVLVENDLLEVVGWRREGRGRPKQVYGLSRHVLGDGLDELSGSLLDEWLGGLSENEREQALGRLAGRLAGPSEANAPLTRRLAVTVERLNRMHYQSRWEASPSGPRLILGHCPYAAIIKKHPELCRMDALLLEQSLGRPLKQTAKLERLGSGLPQCIFLVG